MQVTLYKVSGDEAEITERLTKIAIVGSSIPNMGSSLTDAIKEHAFKAEFATEPLWMQQQKNKRLRPKR